MTLYEFVLFFTIILSVFHFFSRIFENFGRKSSEIKKYLLILSVILCVLLQKHIFYLVCVAFIPLFLLILIRLSLNLRNKSKILENYVSFVEKLNLKVQNQQSFMQSLRELDAESDAFMQQNAFIKDEFVLFSTQKTKKLSKFQKSIMQKLRFIQNHPHQLHIFLQEWLNEEKQVAFFRHKSGQVSFQAKFQAGVISGLYLVLVAYQSFLVGYTTTFQYVFWSFPLLLISYTVIYKILKGFKWKI